MKRNLATSKKTEMYLLPNEYYNYIGGKKELIQVNFKLSILFTLSLKRTVG